VSLIALITAGPVTAGEWGNVDLAQSNTRWAQNCEIFSFTGIDIPGPFKVLSGPNDKDTFRADVCARVYLDVGFEAKGTPIPDLATKLTDVAVIAPQITLGRKSKTSECVYDDGQLLPHPNLNASRICPQQTSLTPPAGVASILPDEVEFNLVVPFPTSIPAGAGVINVAAGQNYLLSPGNYGRIVVQDKGRLVFQKKGTYNFQSIASESPDSPLYADFLEPNVNVNVVDYVLLGHRTKWNNPETRNIKVNVAGAGPFNVPGWGATEPTFRMRGDGHFHSCWVYSPNGTQMWRGHSHRGDLGGPPAFHVQSFTKQFIQESVLSVSFAHPQEEECFGPEYVCATIGRIVPPGVTCDSASGVVSLPAWSASEKSLSYVGLIREDALLPLAPTVKEFIDASCVMFPSGPTIPLLPGVNPNPVTYLSPGQVENVIQTPDIWAAGVLGPKPECPDIPTVRLVPFALGPIVEGNVDRPPVCFSAATFQFLKAEFPDTCTMVDP
jgi:hypothetical protein